MTGAELLASRRGFCCMELGLGCLMERLSGSSSLRFNEVQCCLLVGHKATRQLRSE